MSDSNPDPRPDSAEDPGTDASRRDFLKRLAYLPPVVETVYLLSDTGTAGAASPIGNEPPPPPVDPPNIVLCSPNSGNKGVTMDVTISGTDFQSGATVQFGAGIDELGVTFISSTTLVANIFIRNGAALGSRNVTVTNPDSQSDTLISGFTVTVANPPNVISCSPNSGSKGASLNVTVSGTDFQSGATADFGARIRIDGVTFISSSTLIVAIFIRNTAATGPRDVKITNPDNQSDTLVAGFTVTA